VITLLMSDVSSDEKSATHAITGKRRRQRFVIQAPMTSTRPCKKFMGIWNRIAAKELKPKPKVSLSCYLVGLPS
jgi:hypothetical protein